MYVNIMSMLVSLLYVFVANCDLNVLGTQVWV